MKNLRRRAARTDKFLLIALSLFIVLPAFAVAGWLIWLASDQRPWLMSFGFVLVVLFLVMWPFEFLLKQQPWFSRMAGGGRFQERILKFLTFYFPCLIIVGVNDLEHERGVADNLHEYALSIVMYVVLLVVLETIFEAISRYWRSKRQKSGERD